MRGQAQPPSAGEIAAQQRRDRLAFDPAFDLIRWHHGTPAVIVEAIEAYCGRHARRQLPGAIAVPERMRRHAPVIETGVWYTAGSERTLWMGDMLTIRTMSSGLVNGVRTVLSERTVPADPSSLDALLIAIMLHGYDRELRESGPDWSYCVGAAMAARR